MDNDISWQFTEVKKGTGRTVQVHGIRVSRAKIEAGLTPEQKDAAREIARAYDDLESGFGYALLGIKTFNPMRVRGGEPSQEVIDAIRARLGKLHQWEFHIAKLNRKPWRDAVYILGNTSETASDYALRLGINKTTVMRWHQKGLEEYCEIFFKKG